MGATTKEFRPGSDLTLYLRPLLLLTPSHNSTSDGILLLPVLVPVRLLHLQFRPAAARLSSLLAPPRRTPDAGNERVFVVARAATMTISPDTIRTAIGVVGNGTALVLFLSPVPTFIRIWKKGSVEQYSAVPYVATLLNCMMWVLYGLPAVHPHSMLVITINGTGMAIELTYIALFLAFSAGAVRRRVLLLLAAEVAFVAAVAALVLSLAHTHDRRSMIVGILCVLFGTGMYAAPLSVMLILYAIYYKSTQQIMEARKRKADQAVAMTEVVVDSSAAAKNGGHY
uniref:Bidirectional sugar transporter SWEET n=1 Tax=Leersia perrieri TaxID=77586 RepID=A0A0D9VF47_9ORYZ